MKVFIIQLDATLYGGAEHLILNLIKYLRKKNVEIEFLSLCINERIKEEIKGVKIVEVFEKKEAVREKYLYFKGFLKLRNYLKKEYDITNSIANPHNFPAEYLPIPFVKNIVWMCNEPPMPIYFSKSKISRIFSSFDKILTRRYIKISVVSDEFNAKRFEEIYRIKPRIINYGIDYDFFSKGKRKRTKDFVLIQVGTITPLKNQIESIKVVEKLKDKIPNIKLYLVGWGERNYENFLKAYIEKKKLEDRVIFTGHLKREKVRDLYKISNVAIFPIKSQGGWLSPFEALSAGVPIIVSKEITCRDIILYNDLGIVTDNFEQAVLEIYENEKEYQRKVKIAKLWIMKNLTWEKFSKRMLEVFEECLKR